MINKAMFKQVQTFRRQGYSKGAIAKALAEQLQMRELDKLGFEERPGMLVDREMTERHNRRLRLRLRKARLRLNAVLEDVDYRQPRGLDKSVVLVISGLQAGEQPCSTHGFHECRGFDKAI